MVSKICKVSRYVKHMEVEIQDTIKQPQLGAYEQIEQETRISLD